MFLTYYLTPSDAMGDRVEYVFVGGFFFVSNFVATVASAVVKLSE